MSDLPEKWQYTTIGELCNATNGTVQTGPFGSDLHANDYSEYGTPVIMPANLGKNTIIEEGIARVDDTHVVRLSNHKVITGDIVFPRRGDVARYVVVDERHAGWLCGTGCLRIRFGVNEIIEPQFLGYWLGTSIVEGWLLSNAVGTTMPNLNTSILKALPVPLPPINEQREIARILSSLDDKIELNRRMNATLEATARALFQSWFVDFDPVRAKAEGRQPDGMDADTAALFPDGFEESEMGLIPRGWQVGRLSETIQIIGGGTPKTSVQEYWDGDIFWFSVKDVPADSDVFVIETEKRITQAGLDNSSTKLLPELTTIITARGTVGKLALTGVEMTMNQSCYAIRGVSGYSDFFTYFHLKTRVAQLQQQTHGTVFDTITTATFANLFTVLPQPQIAQFYDSVVEPMLSKIRNNVFESRTLAETRDALLPKLISGQIRVKDGTNA